MKGCRVQNIAILDDYTGAALGSADWTQLESDFTISVFNSHFSETETLIERLKDFEIICAMRERTPFPAEVFGRLPNLKLFVTSGMRNASVDIAAAEKQGVVVCGTDGSFQATPEHSWGLLLACARNIHQDSNALSDGKWQTQLGIELYGKTIGLLGLGRIGARVAEFASVFGMQIIAWSPNLTQARCDEVGVGLVSKDELFKNSDFVSIHLVLGDRSRNLVNNAEFDAMKPSAFLINTSRGPIVNEDALVEAIEKKKIRGAGIDVFEIEPLPVHHRLRQLSNLTLTPHTGYFTEEAFRTFYTQMIENICAWKNSKPIRVLSSS